MGIQRPAKPPAKRAIPPPKATQSIPHVWWWCCLLGGSGGPSPSRRQGTIVPLGAGWGGGGHSNLCPHAFVACPFETCPLCPVPAVMLWRRMCGVATRGVPPCHRSTTRDRSIFLHARPRCQQAHQVLGVQRSATSEQVRAAFLNLAKKYHPDVNPDDPEAHENFVKVQAAYREMSNSRSGSSGPGPSGTAEPQKGTPSWNGGAWSHQQQHQQQKRDWEDIYEDFEDWEDFDFEEFEGFREPRVRARQRRRKAAKERKKQRTEWQEEVWDEDDDENHDPPKRGRQPIKVA